MHSYIKICLTEWFWMSLVSTAQNQVLQKHLDSRVSMFLGLQLREVEIRCFVACSGKVVSGSHGLSEPWEFWPQRPYLYKILMLNNMCRSWVVKSSWPLKRYRLQIQAFVIGLPIKKIWELIMLKPKNYPLKPSLTLKYQKFKECYIVGYQKIWFCLETIAYKKVCYLYSPLSFRLHRYLTGYTKKTLCCSDEMPARKAVSNFNVCILCLGGLEISNGCLFQIVEKCRTVLLLFVFQPFP